MNGSPRDHLNQSTPYRDALEKLASALDTGDFVTTLTTSHDRSRLTVTSRHADIGEDIHTADGWFWWSWAERIVPVSDVAAAAGKVATVLGAAPPGADQHPAPGHDEIIVAAPPGRCLCNSKQHAELGCLADVVVTFGQLGTRWQRDALWQDCWGRSYALCSECWDATRQVAEKRRPGLIITETTAPPPRFPRRPGEPV